MCAPIGSTRARPSESPSKQPDERGLRGQHPVAVLQPEDDAKRARALVGVGLCIPALDLRHTGFVWFAVARSFRDRSVTPVPLDRRAVVVLKVVVATLEFRGCGNTGGHHSGYGCRLERKGRPLRFFLLVFLVGLLLVLVGLGDRHTRIDDEQNREERHRPKWPQHVMPSY